MSNKQIRDGKILIPLDAETARRLLRLADICGDDPVTIAASLLHDILEDDELAHQTVN